MRRRRSHLTHLAEQFSGAITRWTGSTIAFVLACLVIVVWGVTGPLFDYSDTWQLVINTSTTVVTFLMVFLIQLKLNELVAAMAGASNRLIDCEDMSEAELRALHRHYSALVEMARKDGSLTKSHSVEEAEERHARKARRK